MHCIDFNLDLGNKAPARDFAKEHALQVAAQLQDMHYLPLTVHAQMIPHALYMNRCDNAYFVMQTSDTCFRAFICATNLKRNASNAYEPDFMQVMIVDDYTSLTEAIACVDDQLYIDAFETDYTKAEYLALIAPASVAEARC